MPTVDERARSMLAVAIETMTSEGDLRAKLVRDLPYHELSPGQQYALAALTTAISQLDEPRAAALEEAVSAIEQRIAAYVSTRAPGWQEVEHEGLQNIAAIRHQHQARCSGEGLIYVLDPT